MHHGEYVKTTNYSGLTNLRCHIKDRAANRTYRNNWCINEGGCESCGICKGYKAGYIILKKPRGVLGDPSIVNPENIYNA